MGETELITAVQKTAFCGLLACPDLFNIFNRDLVERKTVLIVDALELRDCMHFLGS